MTHNYVTFTTGNRELDKILGELSPRYVLLVVGHPGAGKTTLASQICYHNALRGLRCLYLSFYEDKEKLFRNMKKLGINLEEVEAKKLLDFVRLPVVSVEESLITISQILAKNTYRVVIIDSVNSILDMIDEKGVQRAVLLNFFYQLANLSEGLLVIVAEVPLGTEILDIGVLEFMADAVIYLKHKIEHGSISRVIELRKVRGSPIKTAEMAFSITEQGGIELHVVPQLERTIDVSSKPLGSTLSITSYMMGQLHRGNIVLVSTPSYAKDLLPIIPIMDVAITNNMEILFATFGLSPGEVKYAVSKTMSNFLCVNPTLVYRYLEKRVHILSLNPTTSSIPQLFADIVREVRRWKPGIVVLHGLESIEPLVVDLREYWVTLVNSLLWIKNMGKATVCLISRCSPKWVAIHESIADNVIRYYYVREKSDLKLRIRLNQTGEKPRVYEIVPDTFKNISKEVEELVKLISEQLGDP